MGGHRQGEGQPGGLLCKETLGALQRSQPALAGPHHRAAQLNAAAERHQRRTYDDEGAAFQDWERRRRLTTLCFLSTSPQIYFYASYLFKESGIPAERIPYVTIGTGACECITALTCVSTGAVDGIGDGTIPVGRASEVRSAHAGGVSCRGCSSSLWEEGSSSWGATL